MALMLVAPVLFRFAFITTLLEPVRMMWPAQ